MSIQIEFPQPNLVDTPRYRITETEQVCPLIPEYNEDGDVTNFETRVRQLGSVAYSAYQSIPYTQQITVQQAIRPIGRSSSLLAAIRGIVAFHKLTDYQHAPWEVE